MENILTGDQHYLIISALKRVFSRSDIAKNFLKSRRIEKDWIKKDGSIGARQNVYYKCDHCNKEFSYKQIQIDHIIPVIPENIPSKYLSYDFIITRLFCNEDNLQILCKEDHHKKSTRENLLRKEWSDKEKFIVYKIINKINGRYYIGVHGCTEYDDGYLGSGVLVKRAVTKYGKNNFYKQILAVYDNADEAYLKERELITPEFIQDDMAYNVYVGGIHSKRIICHQTGEIFESIQDAAKMLQVDTGWLARAIDNPSQPIKSMHFFTANTYTPNIPVFFPRNETESPIICLNTKESFISIKSCAEKLNLNYKSLRNSLCSKTKDNVYTYKNLYFLYLYEYDKSCKYEITETLIRCKELNRVFNSCREAAKFLGIKNIINGGIAIGKACREGCKIYKFHWEYETTTLILN